MNVHADFIDFLAYVVDLFPLLLDYFFQRVCSLCQFPKLILYRSNQFYRVAIVA